VDVRHRLLRCLAGEVLKSLQKNVEISQTDAFFDPALHWHPKLMVVAAGVLAIERLVFIWVHVK
jgi:hypothetical protein